MSVTVGDFSCATLTAQPYTYQETDTVKGLTSRGWLIEGIVTPAVFIDLLSEYEAWRDLRIEDDDSLVTESTGTVVQFSGTGVNGETWTDVDCWFTSAPTGAASGAYIAISFSLVDADQELQVLLRSQELQAEQEDLPDLGTFTIGSATLTLTKPPDTYINTPTVELTAAGKNYISGSLSFNQVKDVEGTGTAADWDEVRAWYEATIPTTPTAGDYYPLSNPTATAERKVVNGVKTTVYTISISLAVVV